MQVRNPTRPLLFVVLLSAILASPAAAERLALSAAGNPVVRTFESEPTGRPPAGVTVHGSVLVADVTANSRTTRAMHLLDRTASRHTRAIVASAAQQAKHIEFDLLARDATDATLLVVHGGGAAQSTGAWRFVLDRESAGSATAIVSVYDSKSWRRLARVPGLFEPDTWQHIAIDVSPRDVVLTIGGNRYKTQIKAASSTTITDVEFASEGTAPAAHSAYVDNLVIDAMPATDARLAGVTPVISPTRLVLSQPQRDATVATFNAPGRPSSEFSADVSTSSAWTQAEVTGPDAGGTFTVRASYAIDSPGSHPLSVRVRAGDDAPTTATSWVTIDPYGLVATDPAGTEIRFPDILRLDDGTLLAVYHSATAHANANGTIKMVKSTDLGRTWTSPSTVWGDAYDSRDPKLARLTDGTVLLTFFQTKWVNGVQENRGAFIMRWEPGASGFSPPVRVDTAHSLTYSHGSAVELPDGDVLLPLYGGGARVARSHDGGRTFDVADEVFIAPDTATRIYQEPIVTLLPTGNLVVGIRTHDRTAGRTVNATVSRSADGGRTWSTLENSDYLASSHHQLLTSDGKLLLTYGHIGSSGARPTRATMIAEPEGPWTGYRSVELYDAGTGFDQANPSTVEIEPGRYLTLGFDIVDRTLVAVYSTDGTYE